MISVIKNLLPHKAYKLINAQKNILDLRFSHTTCCLKDLDKPIYVVATPGNLPCLKLCLDHIPKDEKSVVILNGLEPWEQNWAQKNLCRDGFVIIKKMVRHSFVVDFLIKRNSGVFGILDFDCFVFDPGLFKTLQKIPDNSIFSSYYGKCTNDLGIIFPETFFLYMNADKLRKISKNYRADSLERSWNELSARTRRALKKLGLSETVLPESFKEYYDTSRALMALGLVENFTFNYPAGSHANSENQFVFHIGYMASVPLKGVNASKWYQARGSYFWNRALEVCEDDFLQRQYIQHYGYTPSEDILKLLPESENSLFYKNNFIDKVQTIIS